MTFVLWLHIFAAIFVIGPLTVAMSAAPGAIKDGAEALPLLRWFHRTTRFYGLATLLVIATGAWIVPLDDDVSFSTATTLRSRPAACRRSPASPRCCGSPSSSSWSGIPVPSDAEPTPTVVVEH